MPRKPNSSPQFRALLAAFSERADEWVHGYDLMKATGMKSGTLYPLLIRLHGQGYLDAKWVSEGGTSGRPRHTYRLTPFGAAAAAALRLPASGLQLQGMATGPA